MNNFSQRLLKWFDQHGRKDLPWQTRPTPYRVWVSEIMLQQTQVATVIPYFKQFMQSFPSLKALANAEQDEVMAHWAGLGYYQRARNLHRSANIILSDHAGRFPTTFADVLALPGIGRSTAGAILAQSKQQRHPILDGNVKRVLCRFFAIEGHPSLRQVETQLWAHADALTPTERTGDYTQAIMDLGATLCTRKRPQCDQCPMRSSCQAFAQHKVGELPTPKPKKTKPTRQTHMLLVKNKRGHTWLTQRPDRGIWGGLWSLPEFETRQAAAAWLQTHFELPNKPRLKALPKYQHTFTHYHLHISPWIASVDNSAPTKNNTAKQLWYAQQCVGLPKPVADLLAEH